MAEKFYVPFILDGVQLNARHFASMKKAEAMEAMESDGILKEHEKDKKWASQAYDGCAEAVKVADTPKKETETTETTNQ